MFVFNVEKRPSSPLFNLSYYRVSFPTKWCLETFDFEGNWLLKVIKKYYWFDFDKTSKYDKMYFMLKRLTS